MPKENTIDYPPLSDWTDGEYCRQRDFILGVVNNLKDVVFQTDTTGRWTFLNPAWTELTGFTVSESLGELFLNYVHPDDREHNNRLFAPLITRQKEFCRHSVRYLCKTGGFRWVEVFARLTLDDQNEIVGTSGTLTDITERVASEEMLRESEARKTAIVESALDCIITMDEEGRIVEFNLMAERTFGYRRQEVIGQSLAELLIPPSHREAHLRGLANFRATGEGPILGKRVEMTALHRDGHTFPIEIAVSAIVSRGKSLFTAYLRDISARKETERLLQAQNEFNQAILQTVGALVMVLDRTGRIIAFNPACEAATGYPSEVIVGKGIWEAPFYPRGEQEAARALWANFNDSWRPQRYEAVLWNASGEERTISWTNTALHDTNGEIVHIISAGLDVTEQRRAETDQQRTLVALEQANRYVQRITDTTPNLIRIFDIETRCNIWSNREIGSSLGYTPEQSQEPLEPFLPSLIHPDDAGRISSFMERLRNAADGQVQEIEYRVRDASDAWRWLRERSAVFFRDAAGRVTQILSTTEDITQRRGFEESLRQSEVRLRALIANFRASVLVEDESRRIILANQRFCDEFQIPAPPEVLVGADCSGAAQAAKNLFQDPEGFVRGIDRALALREPLTGEILPMADGRILERDYVPIQVGSDYRGHLWLYRDITQRKISEQRLQALAVELQRSNRELDHFASVASHDLQEPLRKIQMFGGRLNSEIANQLTPNGKYYLDAILSATRRMKGLIDDLLRFSRITTKARPFTRVDLNHLVSEVVEDLEARIRETGAQMEIGNLPTIEADVSQMRQVFLNLLGNALKFHKKDTPLRIRIGSETAGDGLADGGCRITVIDNGIGFDPEYNEVIFEIFERLHEQGAYEGTGIGLAICRKIVERHQGTITAVGKLNEGAVFTLVLPLVQSAAEPVRNPKIPV